jgi:hypothetical protein
MLYLHFNSPFDLGGGVTVMAFSFIQDMHQNAPFTGKLAAFC